jgi:hypothetical protein
VGQTLNRCQQREKKTYIFQKLLHSIFPILFLSPVEHICNRHPRRHLHAVQGHSGNTKPSVFRSLTVSNFFQVSIFSENFCLDYFLDNASSGLVFVLWLYFCDLLELTPGPERPESLGKQTEMIQKLH